MAIIVPCITGQDVSQGPERGIGFQQWQQYRGQSSRPLLRQDSPSAGPKLPSLLRVFLDHKGNHSVSMFVKDALGGGGGGGR